MQGRNNGHVDADDGKTKLQTNHQELYLLG